MVVDSRGCPTGSLLPTAPGTRPGRQVPVTLQVHLSAALPDVVRRATTRSAEHRFDPVVAVDPTGSARTPTTRSWRRWPSTPGSTTAWTPCPTTS